MSTQARLGRILGWLTPVVATTMALSSAPSWAQTNDATRILKAMSDFIAMQQNISITFDADIEVVTPDVQKIQFTNSGTVLMSRPDKLRATRTGGYADVELKRAIQAGLVKGPRIITAGPIINITMPENTPFPLMYSPKEADIEVS